MFGKRILILVPHPDDEVVACAATLERAKTSGAEIFALYLTHGCITKDVMWPWQRKKYNTMVGRRQAEAEAVASYLGVVPVGWSDRPARYLWQNMNAVFTEIQSAISAHHIDQIWLPAYEGGNPDHDALNALGRMLLQDRSSFPPPCGEGLREGGERLGEMSQLLNKAICVMPPSLALPTRGREPHRSFMTNDSELSILEFAEYNFFAGKAQSNSFPEMNGTEQIINLSETEQKIKRAALALYKSEQSNLNYIEVDRECCRPLADYDYSKPPHAGKLWYARFQWVPFKHPRVDFTNPMDVCKAITDFMKTEL